MHGNCLAHRLEEARRQPQLVLRTASPSRLARCLALRTCPVISTEYMNHRINECTRDLTPRAAERALPKADEGAQPSCTLVATGRGRRVRRHPPPGVVQRAPGRGTCTSRRGHGHAPPSPARPALPRTHARALQPAAGSARKPTLTRAPAAPRASARWGALASHPARPQAGASSPTAILLPPPGARASYLRAEEGGGG